MVVEKIKNDPDWRMWATIFGMMMMVLGPLSGGMAWMYSENKEQIDLRIIPLQNGITAMQKLTTGIEDLVDLKLESILMRLNALEISHTASKSWTKNDDEKAMTGLRTYIIESKTQVFDTIRENKDLTLEILKSFKVDTRLTYNEVLRRLTYLEQAQKP